MTLVSNGPGNFVPYRFTYADAAARTGDTGLAAGDVGSVALQLDDGTLWRLTAATPTWAAVAPVTAHTHAAADVTSGTLATARLGSGTADATTYLRGDQTWATPAGGGAVATDPIWDAAGDLAVGSGANTAARLAMGSPLTYVRVNAAGTALEYGTPSGGGALTTANAALAADVAVPLTSAFTDGPSVSLAAGTWLVWATVSLQGNTATCTAKLWDGTTAFASTGSTNANNAYRLSLSLHGPVVLASTTTIKVSVAANGLVDMKAATFELGSGNHATRITAIQVA